VLPRLTSWQARSLRTPNLNMKNVMVVDGAENCVYDIVAAPDDAFALIFPEGTDVAFIEDIERGPDAARILASLNTIWSNRVPKSEVMGIHGIVFYDLYRKRKYYPTLRDEEAANPDGSRLR
jgi:hypothetical protein